MIILTGATGGMGRATTHLLRKHYHVVAIGQSVEKLNALKCDRLTVLGTDIADDDFLSQLVPQIPDLPLAGLVNMAGVSVGAPTETLSDSDWQYSFAVNVDAPMKLIRWAGPIMASQGAGSIVNVSSPVALVGAKKASYAASKAALQGLTLSAAREYGAQGVRVNLLLPGPTITDMTEDWPPEKRAAIASGSFLKRLTEADEVADVIAFLLSDASRGITASTLDITAGSSFGH